MNGNRPIYSGTISQLKKEFSIEILSLSIALDVDGNKTKYVRHWDPERRIALVLLKELAEEISMNSHLLLDATSEIRLGGTGNYEAISITRAAVNNNISQVSALEEHMKSFDDLGFNNPNVYNWRTSVLQALEENSIKMSDFYFSSSNKNNKDLLQHIALKGATYVLLNLKGLINRGFCPITGETIDNTYQYNIFKRSIYLSEKGLEVCKGIDREAWGNKNIDYDRFQESKQKIKGRARIVTLTNAILSLVISWKIVSPDGFLTSIGAIILASLFFGIFWRIFTFFFSLYLKKINS